MLLIFAGAGSWSAGRPATLMSWLIPLAQLADRLVVVVVVSWRGFDWLPSTGWRRRLKMAARCNLFGDWPLAHITSSSPSSYSSGSQFASRLDSSWLGAIKICFARLFQSVAQLVEMRETNKRARAELIWAPARRLPLAAGISVGRTRRLVSFVCFWRFARLKAVSNPTRLDPIRNGERIAAAKLSGSGASVIYLSGARAQVQLPNWN